MRMLCLHHGSFSGITRSLLDAWRSGSRHVVITACDLDADLLGTWTSRLRAVPALRRFRSCRAVLQGVGALRNGAKRSPWYLERLADSVARKQRSHKYDFSLSIQSIVPVMQPQGPHFVYTDHTILANHYYPGGEEVIRRWGKCLSYERRTLEQASMVFTMSRHISDSLVEHYGLPPERVLCVRGGCNSPPVPHIGSGPAADRSHGKNIVFVGIDWERKGGPMLVRAFSKVRGNHPDATLTIIGCTPNVSEAGVEVVGPVPLERVPDYLSRATVFCMPSLREPFGIAYLEAMQAGLPVVALNLGAPPDFITNGETGFTVAPGDIDALAGRLEELMACPEKCRRMGQRARALVESRYTWKQTQEEMLKAIQASLCQAQAK